MSKLHDLHELGQSTWLNYMRRSFVRSGEMRSLVADGIQGITASAATFQRAILASSDYDEAIRQAVKAGLPARGIQEALQADDVQHAADRLRPTYEATDATDGFVSFELDPAALRDPHAAVARARHFLAAIDRDNVMVEVPATPGGLQAITILTSDGVSINATHIFSAAQYERVADAYLTGLASYVETHSVWRKMPTAVASISLSAIDNAVDAYLRAHGRPEWQGKAALAQARLLYHRFHQIFASRADPRWGRLTRHDARPLRPKWTRLLPRSFAYADTFYLDALIAPDTVLTFSRPTLLAFLDHGLTVQTLTDDPAESQAFLQRLAALGLDLDALADDLQDTYMAASERQFQRINDAVKQKRDDLESDWRRLERRLGRAEATVDNALEDLCDDRILFRIWSGDHTVWSPRPAGITDRLGWLHVADLMQDQAPAVRAFAEEVVRDGLECGLVIGMDGAGLLPALFHQTFGRPSRPDYAPHPFLDLTMLDRADPQAIQDVMARLDVRRTLFLVASKAGDMGATLSTFETIWNWAVETLGAEGAGKQFVAVTNPGSPLAATANRLGFRRLFLDDPRIAERYAALSFFGLVPAALVGVDLDRLLAQATAMATNAETCRHPLIRDNLAAQLGATLGTLAREGRDRMTLIIPPALQPFARWIEHLVAAGTGGRIRPAVGEPPLAPGDAGADRLFVQLRLADEASQDATVAALVAAGQPAVILRLRDRYDLGGQFFLWQMATAVAGHLLEVNPFGGGAQPAAS